MLTQDQVVAVVPTSLRSAITQQFVDQINNIVQDPLIAEMVRNNFLSYTSVLKDGKFKTEDYLHAVTYVSFKLMGMSNQDAWIRTFPQRHATLQAKGAEPKEISAHVSAYNKGKLVNAIMEQSLVPSWVLNQDLYQKAINRLAYLMINANSEKVQGDAAANLVNALAKPKEAGPLVAIDMKETVGITELKQSIAALARQQQEALASGMTPKEIAGSKLIEHDPTG